MEEREQTAAAQSVPQDACESSREENREAARRLSRLKADELILIDLVTAKSRKVELMTRAELEAAFREKAALAPEPRVDELFEEAEDQMNRTYNRAPGTVSFVPPKTRNKAEREKNRELVPKLRDQREAFTRRELLRCLVAGDLPQAEALAESAQAEEAAQVPAEPREITPEYFEEVLSAVLADDCGVAKLVAWDDTEYYHFRPLLSASYARILSAKNNPIEQLCDRVRECSRVYPRPVLLGSFQDEPFNFTPEELQEILQKIPEDPKTSDIKFTESSLGTVFLYSNRYLDDDYADFLVEHIDVDLVMSP